jgi:hypothetical protein
MKVTVQAAKPYFIIFHSSLLPLRLPLPLIPLTLLSSSSLFLSSFLIKEAVVVEVVEVEVDEGEGWVSLKSKSSI